MFRTGAQQKIDDALAPVRVAYFVRVRNIGDRINPNLLEAILLRRVTRLRDPTLPHILAVGSVFADATPQSFVWGTGVMHPDFGVGDPDPARVLAVRGKLTHAELSRVGKTVKDIPLGDPAFLIRRFLPNDPAPPVRFELGIVPHYVDRAHPFVMEKARLEEIKILDPAWPPEIFFEEMRRCRTIISSSLHGLIFAEALGLPNLWISLSDEIAGDSFKFRDWFSLAQNPQAAAIRPSLDEPAAALIARCETRLPDIDMDALASALTPAIAQACAEPSAVSPRRRIPVAACRGNPLPVFVISYNRADALKRVVASYRRQTQPVEIIIHDNGSDDPATLALLDELSLAGVKIYRRSPIGSPNDLNLVNESVTDYFQAWAEPSRYVVTDCDIDLGTASADALFLYDELLDQFRRAACVGPMLRISDISQNYFLFNHVMNRHIGQFWRQDPLFTSTSLGRIAYIEAPIDTTFALHRAGEPFCRLKQGLRTYFPYEATHLDWYLEKDAPDSYYEGSSAKISHWNNKAYYERNRQEALLFDDYKVVELDSEGHLVVSLKRPLADNPA
jgi:hypothetical protein